MESMDVVVRRYIDFLILLILTPLVSVLFFKCFSFLFQYFFVIEFYVLNNFPPQYKHTHRRLQASHGSHMKGCTQCFIHEAHTNERFISCDGHQLYAFKGRSVDLEVEGVRYIEMYHGHHTC